MPLGEVIFTQRSIRRFRPDPLPVADLRLLVEAAVRAPNGANRQIARFLVVTDRERIRAFGQLYHEAWWAKRWDDHRWTRPEDIPVEDTNHRAAMALADHMGDVPCVVFALAEPPGWANSVIPGCQNLVTFHFGSPSAIRGRGRDSAGAGGGRPRRRRISTDGAGRCPGRRSGRSRAHVLLPSRPV